MPLPSRRFGIELEFSGSYHRPSYYDAERLLHEYFYVRRLPFSAPARYQRSSGRHWELKPDSSCGLELATPALSWSQWPQVVEVCKFLKDNQYPVNWDCSVHVHHEIVGFNSAALRRLFRLWTAVEPIALRCCAAHRTQNDFTAPLYRRYSASTWEHVVNVSGGSRDLRRWYNQNGRRFTLNLLPFWLQGTAEVRLHHGTWDAEELRWWVLFTQGVVELSTRRLRTTTLRNLYNSGNLESRLEQFTALALRYAESDELREVINTIPNRMAAYPELNHEYRSTSTVITTPPWLREASLSYV